MLVMVSVLFIAGVVALGTFNILKKKQLLNDDSTKEWINILLSFIKITLVMVAGIFFFFFFFFFFLKKFMILFILLAE